MTLTFHRAFFFIFNDVEETTDIFEKKNVNGRVAFRLYPLCSYKKGGNAGILT